MKQRHVRGAAVAPVVVDLRPSPPSPGKGPRKSTKASIGFLLVAAGALLWMLMRLAKILGEGGHSIPSFGMYSRNRRPTARRRLLPPRFPRYGTPEFVDACKWAVDGESEDANAATSATNNASRAPNVTSLVPWVLPTEGIAAWVAAVAQSFIYSRYLGRQNHGPPPAVLLEFGTVNLTKVMDHPEARRHNPGWKVGARGCRGRGAKCMTIQQNSPRGIAPDYRFVYKHAAAKSNCAVGKSHIGICAGDFEHLYQALPGFTIETGMACALNSMWEPSRSLVEYEPQLFTRLLPALRGPSSDDSGNAGGPRDTLVLTLYLRTGWTDHRVQNQTWHRNTRAQAQKALSLWGDEFTGQKADGFLNPFVECARQLEQEYFANYSSQEAAFSKIVWMVSADSFVLKKYVHDKYGGQEVALAPSISAESDAPTVSVSRNVVYTGVDGKHTKLQWDPGQAALAEGYLDWHLMGESDALIAEGDFYTFGTTAALRTARPVYFLAESPYAKRKRGSTVPACTRKVLVRAE